MVTKEKPIVARETPCYYGNPLLLGNPKQGNPSLPGWNNWHEIDEIEIDMMVTMKRNKMTHW